MYPFSTKLKPQELAESFGPVATVNGFHHSAFADAVKGWSQDLANNWVSPYQHGKFVGYQKQLLAFQEEARAVEPGDVIQVEAALDNTLSFQFSAKWCVCWVMES